MMKNILLSLTTVLSIAGIAGVVYVNTKMSKVVVVDVIKVCNEFKMKKDLEAKVDGVLDKYAARVDSLNALMNMAKDNNDEMRIELLTDEINIVQKEAADTYDLTNKSINEQVWKRLNPLIDEYSKENNYRLVIGANGMGTVLYNVPEVDKTSEMIKYVNDSYEKGTK